uniref:RNase H type-1 domain-containing protein n=1 Tax=Oryza barthii TaxID=65489 RepID=A0A0D3FHD5_9ORYZ
MAAGREVADSGVGAAREGERASRCDGYGGRKEEEAVGARAAAGEEAVGADGGGLVTIFLVVVAVGGCRAERFGREREGEAASKPIRACPLLPRSAALARRPSAHRCSACHSRPPRLRPPLPLSCFFPVRDRAHSTAGRHARICPAARECAADMWAPLEGPPVNLFRLRNNLLRGPFCGQAAGLARATQFRSTNLLVRWDWEPPRAGWFKLNFDGCVYHDGSGSASIGGAIRGPASVAFAETTDHWSIGVRGGGPRGALIRGLRLVSLSPVSWRGTPGDDLLLVSSCCVATGAETQTRIPAALHDEIVTLLGCFAERQSRRLLGDGPQLRVFEEMHAQTPSSGCAAAGAKNVETEIVAMAKVGAWARGRIDQLDRHGELKSFASVCISVVVSRCKHV